jgi:serine/threonine protein kinase
VNVPRLAAEGRWEAAAFLAPEQVGRRGSTPASDVFALGGLLAYAATGQLPFGDGSAGDLLQRIARADPLPEALAIADSELRDLVTACLHADPARRPTAAQVVAMATAHRKKAGRSPRSRRRGTA